MDSPLTRRRFGTALLAAGGGSVVGAAAGDDKPAPAGPPPALPVGPAPDVPPLPLPEDLLVGALLQLYPSPHFTPERVEGIRSGLQRNLAQGEILRRVPLTNGDAPWMGPPPYRRK
jgi:hypothetical protein